jgi:hypothetical protein
LKIRAQLLRPLLPRTAGAAAARDRRTWTHPRFYLEPSVALVVQGRKRVGLGDMRFEYDSSRFLLTSVDLPVSSQVIEGSPQAPYLCLRLKLTSPSFGNCSAANQICLYGRMRARPR